MIRPEAPLVGRIVRVEPLEERHREGVRAAAADADVFRYMQSVADFDGWFGAALAGPDVAFAVLAGGREVGSTRYLAYEPEHKRVEIGWTWLAREAWGTGANSETKYLLMRHAFESCGLQRVEFKTHARNERARGALLGIGAQFEGIFRKHMILPSGIRDSAWYAVVDDDWPEVKSRLEERIAAQAIGQE
jgi:RimJ/RimL family protein N-acetyltransferase